jgi:hypothetical protein
LIVALVANIWSLTLYSVPKLLTFVISNGLGAAGMEAGAEQHRGAQCDLVMPLLCCVQHDAAALRMRNGGQMPHATGYGAAAESHG